MSLSDSFAIPDISGSDHDEIDSLPSSSTSESFSSDEDYDEAQREWETSIQQLELLLTMVLVPFAGWARYMEWLHNVEIRWTSKKAFKAAGAAEAAATVGILYKPPSSRFSLEGCTEGLAVAKVFKQGSPQDRLDWVGSPARDAEHLVLCGVVTDCYCETTARSPLNGGWGTLHVSDACGSASRAQQERRLKRYDSDFGPTWTIKGAIAAPRKENCE
ncbi:hypothetical protein DL769_002953 [Monosporascus sp. CRB-8-3]|nr:hypothetical protein DL769_002953 [Monosporascus sp. CRB-8-3]